VGWIIEAKGVLELVAAARRVRGARFTLVGPAEQPFLSRVQREIDGLGGRLRLLPPCARAEVIELYREADVFVLPTWREGFPNVVLEAMAAGLPVVATAVGAIPDALEDGAQGILVPARDVGALATALASLVQDRELRLAMGRRARVRVEERFSLPAVIERLGALYDELAPPS